MKTFQLSEYTRFIRRVLALNSPEAVWISAELGQVNVSRGHTYLTFVEKDKDGESILAQVDGVLWRGRNIQLQKDHGPSILRIFQTGMEVRLRVVADFHDKFGFKLIVADADPVHTLGKLEIKRQETLNRLQAGGFLALNKEKPLPLLPQRLAVISSETAAGYADFRQQLLQNSDRYHYDMTLFPAAMQGEASPGEVSRMLRRIEDRKAEFDAVIIIRGGGARMDLLAFDDEQLCRAAAVHSLPIIVGIGHETDEVLLDYVAQLSLKTPTAVAAFLLDRSARLEGHVLQLAQDIKRGVEQCLRFEQRNLDQSAQQLKLSTAAVLQAQRLRLDHHAQMLPALVKTNFQQANQQLNQLEALLTALRPETTLARGYALVSQNGKIIQKAADVQPGEALKIRFQDGEIGLR